MIATDENRQRLLVELIERSAKIDQLLAETKQNPSTQSLESVQSLEQLRQQQRETTAKLHATENFTGSAWENIGDGG